MTKTIIGASFLAIIFFAVTWIVFIPMNETVIAYISSHVESAGASFQFTVSTGFSGALFDMQLKTALSVAAIPLIALLCLLAVRKFKNQEFPLVYCWPFVILVLVGYASGCALKLMALLQLLKPENLHPTIQTTIALESITFYGYGSFASLVVGVLIFLIVRKKNAISLD